MMRFDPTLLVRRLVVKRNSYTAYDEAFHDGVNVLRGDNSSGKSTILNFIFYGLGGDLYDWSEMALLCTHVWVEVEINGKSVTLRREIVDTSRSAMEIFPGEFSEATLSPIERWTKYPYARTASLESFSQALFRLLGLPEVAGETSGNLTMHQILRLIYADQLSPVDDIFRDDHFDTPTLRETVGNLLCGAYDNEVYELQLKLKEYDRSFKKAEAELRSIFSVLGGNDESVGVDWVQGKIKNLTAEREKLLAELDKAEAQTFSQPNADDLTLQAQQDAYQAVSTAQAELFRKQQEFQTLQLNIADSEEFVQSLNERLVALREAATVAEVFGVIKFGSCPACHAEVEEVEDDDSWCPLCKTPLDKDRADARIAALINETGIQIKQSQLLQEARRQKLDVLGKEVDTLNQKWRSAAIELKAVQGIPTSEARLLLRRLHRRLGYMDRELDDLQQRLKLAQKIGALSERKAELNKLIDLAKTRLGQLCTAQQKRLRSAYSGIEENVKSLLRGDLKRQDSFENPDKIQFSFRDNKVTVDGQTYFSASSRVILKSSFLFGFFWAALQDKEFRYPRFVMIDTTEDKGMEPARSHNFQEQMMAASDMSESAHQIIFATSMPSPDLTDEHFVGPFYTREKGTLRINQG
jgi:DNA repair exonuclease SbcCD ATPase subunit